MCVNEIQEIPVLPQLETIRIGVLSKPREEREDRGRYANEKV